MASEAGRDGERDRAAAAPSRRERELAEAAHEAFQDRDYNLALQRLTELRGLRPGDAKVAHNVAVCEYYRDRSGKAARSLLHTLAALRSSSAGASTPAPGAGAGGTDAGDGADDGAGDAGSACFLYNEAVLLVRWRQFTAAARLLERLFRGAATLEEGLARRVCGLLVEVHLALDRCERAREVIDYMEKAFLGPRQGGGAANGPAPSDGDVGEAARSAAPGAETSDAEDAASLRIQVAMYRARLHLATRNLKLCKREIRSALNADSQNAAALFVKAGYEYYRRNYRKVIKLLNSCPRAVALAPGASAHQRLLAAAREREISIMYFNNLACVHHQVCRFSAASFYLSRALTCNARAPSDGAPPPTKPAAAGTGGGAESESPSPGEALLSSGSLLDCRYELLYNQGVQLLYLGRFESARRCLTVAMGAYYQSPCAWLRLAEAYLGLHLELCMARARLQASTVAETVVAGGTWRARAVLASGGRGAATLRHGQENGGARAEGGADAPGGRSGGHETGSTSPDSSLSLLLESRRCLEAALPLLQDRLQPGVPSASAQAGAFSVAEDAALRSLSPSPSDAPSETSAEATVLPAAAGSGTAASSHRPERGAAVVPTYLSAPQDAPARSLLAATLRCYLAYVCLALDDHATALRHADAVRGAGAGAPAALQFLPLLYSVEALSASGQGEDALVRLAPPSIAGLLSEMDGQGPHAPAEGMDDAEEDIARVGEGGEGSGGAGAKAREGVGWPSAGGSAVIYGPKASHVRATALWTGAGTAPSRLSQWHSSKPSAAEAAIVAALATAAAHAQRREYDAARVALVRAVRAVPAGQAPPIPAAAIATHIALACGAVSTAQTIVRTGSLDR